MFVVFEPQPAPGELPARLAHPFSAAPPHPLARRAAEALRARLSRGEVPVDLSPLQRPGLGKMFGVLVGVDAVGRAGYLSAFSGMLGGQWTVEGFSPPVFDLDARAAFWPEAEASMDADDLRRAELIAAVKNTRDPERSRAEAELALLETERADRSRALWRRIAEVSVLPNARGETATVASLYAPEPPPGGVGECAAPKLLAEAFREGIRPLAIAELWWGAPSSAPPRVPGEFYPACRPKCGRALPFMLQGVDVEEAPEEPLPSLTLLYEDEAVVAFLKPAGLASGPGRTSGVRDSVLTRLRRQLGEVFLVQALESQASGVALAARDRTTLAALQRQLGLGEASVEREGDRVVRVVFRHPRGGARIVVETDVTGEPEPPRASKPPSEA